jgi:peptidyl-prolyl cis-trans isomerase C
MLKRLLPLVLALGLLSCQQAPQETFQGPYLAKVNGKVITAAMVAEEFNELPQEFQELFLKQGGKELLLQELINRELLYQEALRKGLQNNRDFKKAVEDFRRATLIRLLLKREIEDKAQVSEEELRQYYQDHKKDFIINAPGEELHGKTLEFETVKGIIRQRLLGEKQQEMFNAYIKALRDSHQVQIDQKALEELKL